MRNYRRYFSVVAIGWLQAHAIFAGEAPLAYPPTRQADQIDDYHGVKVADPYRWLEDDNSSETKAWVGAQNKVTFGWLGTIPERNAIKERLTRLWNYQRYGVPFKEAETYFFTKN